MTIRAYLVGGAVRDGLLGVSTKDLDYAVEAPSYEAMVEWIREQGQIFLEQPQYWTVRAHIQGKKPADFVLCRKDGQYTDGRRPDSVTVGTLYDDLARRDFTVNAIALDEETNTFIDPFNGKLDLKLKQIKCVGNAHDRFSEDALRMLRAIRFAITKGFTLEHTVQDALSNADLLTKLHDNITVERKREELLRCFQYDTLATLHMLRAYPGIKDACFMDSKLWLMPTMLER